MPLRSAVRYMDFESLWLADPDGPWKPRRGERLELESERRGIRYSVATTFRERTRDPEPLWRLDRPPDGSIQLSPGRADMRQKVWITGANVWVDADKGPYASGRRIPVTVVNLSAGGARLESAREIPRAAELEHTLDFPLPHEHVNLRAEIRIIDEHPLRRFGHVRYQYRTRFVRPTEALTRHIARYVFEVNASELRSARRHATPVEQPYPTPRALSLLVEGAEIRLELEDARGGVRVVSSTIDSLRPNELVVRAPSSPEGLAGVEAGRPMTLLVHDHAAKANVVGETRRVGVVDGAELRWRLRMPKSFGKRIAREFVRWPAIVSDAQVVAVNAAVQPPTRLRTAVTLANLSAGGAAFYSPVALPVGPLTGHHLQFRLPEVEDPFGTRIEILDARRRRSADGIVHLYRSQFTELTPQEREFITRHIFRLQAEQRRQDLGQAS